jgi:Domain of unknown function (DUF4386)
MRTNKTISWLLILGAIGVFVPFTVLTMTFDYPDVLREDPGTVLTKFQAGGSGLIFTWLAFGLLGFPLLIAYVLIGQQLESRLPFMRWATTLGVISGVVQIVGLLRWVFVVPALAQAYLHAPDEATRAAAKMAFVTIHQFGGVLLGEHLGQLLTVAWTVALCYGSWRLGLFRVWVSVLGVLAAVIYFLAQGELLATVIPGFPVWDLAGFLGSTLWLVWLVVIGVAWMRSRAAGG